MKKFLAMVLAMAMVLSMAACAESSGGGNDSTRTDSSSSADLSDTSESSSQSSSEAQTTTTATTSATATEDTGSSSDPETTGTQTSSSSGVDTTTTRDNTPPPAPVGIDLKAVSKSVMGAKELKITANAEKTFSEACDKGAGEYSLVADLKTAELFDPFDDLYLSSNQKALEAAKPDVQAFIYANVYDVVYEDGPSTDGDGMIYALGFNCKDEAEAKKVYSLVLTEEMKENAKTDADKPAYDFGTDHGIVKLSDSGENITMCYYRIGNNVLAAAKMTVDEAEFKKLQPKNYTKQADYDAKLDNICKAFGAAKLPSSLKL